MGQNQRNRLKAISFGTSIPTTFAGMVVGGYYLGRYFDRLFGTQPWLQLFCMLAGLALSIIYLVYALKELGMTENEK